MLGISNSKKKCHPPQTLSWKIKSKYDTEENVNQIFKLIREKYPQITYLCKEREYIFLSGETYKENQVLKNNMKGLEEVIDGNIRWNYLKIEEDKPVTKKFMNRQASALRSSNNLQEEKLNRIELTMMNFQNSLTMVNKNMMLIQKTMVEDRMINNKINNINSEIDRKMRKLDRAITLEEKTKIEEEIDRLEVELKETKEKAETKAIENDRIFQKNLMMNENEEKEVNSQIGRPSLQ